MTIKEQSTCGSGEDDVYAIGDNGTILHWDGWFPLGVRISMPYNVMPGEEFRVRGYLDNPGEPLKNVPVFFVLDIYGGYWFWEDYPAVVCGHVINGEHKDRIHRDPTIPGRRVAARTV